MTTSSTVVKQEHSSSAVVKTETLNSPDAKKAGTAISPAPPGPSMTSPTNTPPKAMPATPIAMSTGDKSIVPILDINPYMGKWSIKGRIVSKKAVRSFKGKGGQDKKVFDLNIMDDTCDIKVTFWDELCDKYAESIEVGKCYTMSKGRLTPANSKFNDTKSQYEMSAASDITIEMCEDSEAPAIKFQITEIDKLEPLVGKNVDVMGVVSEVSALGEITIKNGADAGKQKNKRNISIADKSGKMVSLTLWDDHAMTVTEEHAGNNTIVAVRSVRVSNYNGCSINTTRASMVQINPSLKEAEELREWMATRGDASFQAVGGGGKGGVGGPAPRKMMADIARQGLGLKDKPDIFTVRGTVSYFRNKEKDGKDMVWQYPSNPETKKKVVESGGEWLDESTGKVLPACQRRYILGVKVEDFSGSHFFTAFDDQGKSMLGKSADDLYELHQMDPPAAEAVWKQGLFQQCVFKVRAKNERYQDQDRVKCSILDCQPIRYKEESALLLEQIRKYGIAN